MKSSIFTVLISLALISCGHSKKKSTTDQSSIDPKEDIKKYTVLKKIKIGGEGGWDYTAFDSVNRRLFISHSTKVDVLDVDKEQVIGEIPNTPGVHGIAFDYELNKGFTSNGKDSSVTVFDLKALKVLGKITVTGGNPDCIIYDPFSKHIFTFNGRGENSTVIDPQTDKVIATIPLKGKPEFAISNMNGKVAVNIEDKSSLDIIDSKYDTLFADWKLDTSLQEPSGLSYDESYSILYIGCGNKKMAMIGLNNPAFNRYVCAIGEHVDATAFNSTTKTAFASCGDGTLTIARELGRDTCAPITIKTQKGARTMAIDEKKDLVYLPVADFGPPAAAEPGKKERPSIIPGTFSILVVGKKN